ncbi:UNVERIFIED_CONTAM: hypothetical protein Slati_0928700 [Sesamum latifolium]|uniref:Uncharacterized protein n=1 Tax=Sesamum latifolium TaxID=2727402 RepID=A0AAW2XVV0_9LAMI
MFPSLLQQVLRSPPEQVLGGPNNPTPALYSVALPAAANPLFCEQFHQFIAGTIKSTLLGPLASRLSRNQRSMVLYLLSPASKEVVA